MVVLLQRVKSAEILINQKLHQKINQGLLVLLGINKEDSHQDIDYLIDKIIHLRIFNDSNNKMNLSILDINGEIIIVSQFTLIANTRRGRRPSFTASANTDEAIKLYNLFISEFKKEKIIVKSGQFGTSMDIKLINNGPATFILDSKN